MANIATNEVIIVFKEGTSVDKKKDFMKDKLITQILQVNSISRITNSDRLPKDRTRMISQEDLFLQLVFLSESELLQIANDLNIVL